MGINKEGHIMGKIFRFLGVIGVVLGVFLLLNSSITGNFVGAGLGPQAKDLFAIILIFIGFIFFIAHLPSND